MFLTAPELFAAARGKTPLHGSHICFYCGASCAENNPTMQFVKDSFTGYSDVRSPGSQFICDGCVLCLKESVVITTHNGKQRENQKTRGYSWLITPDKATAATKADREFLAVNCMNPPEPPFAICISDSGQKHLLYRAIVCHSRNIVAVTLEGEAVVYDPVDLLFRCSFLKFLISVIGKPALQEGLSVRQRMTLIETISENAVRQWLAVSGESLTRLALWLSPGKDGSLADLAAAPGGLNYGAIPPASGRIDRPAQCA